MIPVSHEKLLSDDPELWNRVVRGQKPRYTAVANNYPGTDWVVVVNGYHGVTPKAKMAAMLFSAAQVAFSES
jgi:hypothetical protein